MRLLPLSMCPFSPPASILSSSIIFLHISLLTIFPTTSAASPDLRTLTLYYTTPSPAPPSSYTLGPTHKLATLQYSLIPSTNPTAAAKSPKYAQIADATVLSFTPPRNATSPDAYTTILLPHDASDTSLRTYTSISVSTRSFHAPNRGRFLLHLDTDGEAVGARYVAYLAPPAPGNTKKNGDGRDKGEGREGGFDVQWQQEAPRVYLEKAGKAGAAGAQGRGGGGKGVGEEGKEGEEGEKTLFQK